MQTRSSACDHCHSAVSGLNVVCAAGFLGGSMLQAGFTNRLFALLAALLCDFIFAEHKKEVAVPTKSLAIKINTNLNGKRLPVSAFHRPSSRSDVVSLAEGGLQQPRYLL